MDVTSESKAADHGAAPETIDARFVPEFDGPVSLIPVKDEAVLFNEADGHLHQLDVIAALVCRCFDGEATIADIVQDLAEAFSADVAVVEADVLALCRGLGEQGLLRGIAGVPRVEEPDDGC